MTPSAVAKAPIEIATAIVSGEARTAEPPVIVEAAGLGKRFRIYERPIDRLWEWLGRSSRRGKALHTDFWAVRGVSFQVRKGECLGIIGPNGSGKSTLLKMLTGALHPTEGTFRVSGRVLSLIELGTGLNPMLSGRDNIVHAATLLGFPANFAREKMEEIKSFAELGDFFDRPTALYSSGMRVRLAFSMFACFRPELFIVDEALSVGDVFFQQKCAQRIRELLDEGMTMIFVSHDQSAVLNLCDRAIVLNHGEPIFLGGPDEAIMRYIAALSTTGLGAGGGVWSRREKVPVAPKPVEDAGAQPSEADAIIKHDVTKERRKQRYGTGKLKILAARVVDDAGRDAARVEMGERLSFKVVLEAHERIELPRAGIRLFDRFSNLVFSAGTYQLGQVLPAMNPGDRIVVTFTIVMEVEPGKYSFGLGAGEPATDDPNDGVAHDRIDRLGPIIVDLTPGKHRSFFGMARLPMTATFGLCGGAGQ